MPAETLAEERARTQTEFRRALPAPRRGTLSVPAGPGLGVQVEEAALDEVTAEVVA